jgi:hypothetical protein
VTSLFRALALVVTVAAVLSALWYGHHSGNYLALFVLLPIGAFWILEIEAKPRTLLAAVQSILIRILSALALMIVGLILFGAALSELSSPIVFESPRLNAIASIVRLVGGSPGFAVILAAIAVAALVKGFHLLPRTRRRTVNE